METYNSIMPRVSVIIPVYNMADYLEETVKSVLNSDYPNFEIILIDDGSNDSSYDIAKQLANTYPNIKALSQKNAGVSSARNTGITVAEGEYIFPLDADDKIAPQLLSQAAAILQKDSEIKCVTCRAEFFGARQGEWKLPPYSSALLARKNMIPASAMFRKKDWERVGGYDTEILAREDWAFWISVLKDGGKVAHLNETGLYYRIRSNSKRVSDRQLKKHVIDVLNRKYPDFFYRELGGPLRYQRTWSRVINFFSRLYAPMKVEVAPEYQTLNSWIHQLPGKFGTWGHLIYKGRNELKEIETEEGTVIVKSYRRPHLINRLVYAFFRSSKAERAYHYALMFRKNGINSPNPIGYITKGKWGMFDRSYFACLKSECPYTYRDFSKRTFEREEEILQAIGKTTARMHEAGFLHEDYSAGNILFRDDLPEIWVEIIDLNRLTFKQIDIKTGCKNFERLPGNEIMLRTMAKAYADERGFNAEECFQLILKASSSTKH